MADEQNAPMWLVVPWEALAGAANCNSQGEAIAAAGNQVRNDKNPRAVVCVAAKIAADPQPALISTLYPVKTAGAAS